MDDVEMRREATACRRGNLQTKSRKSLSVFTMKEKKSFMLRLSFPKDLLHRRFFRIHQNQQTNTRSSNLHAQQLPSFPKFRRIRLDRKGDEEEGGDETEKRRER